MIDAWTRATNHNAIDRILLRAVDNRDLPGVVAMAASEEGVFYKGAFGARGGARSSDMTLDSIFRIGSLTKAITTTAVTQLVEQGRLDLEQPVARVLPEMASAHVLQGFDENGNPKLRRATRFMKLGHLLTSTAGFGYEIFNADAARYRRYAGLPSIFSGKIAALNTPLLFDPGERWEYGLGTDYAGRIIEAVSGMDLEGYFREHIFIPLGMSDTGFAPKSLDRLVSVHGRGSDGLPRETEFSFRQNPDFFSGGGGLYSTARDYLVFLQMLLHEGTFMGVQLLKPETVKFIRTSQLWAAAIPRLVQTANAALSLDIDFAAMFPGQNLKWGLGFLINQKAGPAGRSAGSLGWAGLANTHYWLDPVKRVTAVMFTQLLPFLDTRMMQVYGQFERGVYNALAALPA